MPLSGTRKKLACACLGSLTVLGAPAVLARSVTSTATIAPPPHVVNTGTVCVAKEGAKAFDEASGACTATDRDELKDDKPRVPAPSGRELPQPDEKEASDAAAGE